MADDRLHWLDELRGVAALSVMIGHGLGDLGWNTVCLLHMPLLALFKNYNVGPYFFVWLLLPILVVVVSDVTYRLIEKRGVAMGRQILSSARFASLLKKA